ncbi:hypothetical protein L9F63_027369, partial [Diploptera punctata]
GTLLLMMWFLHFNNCSWTMFIRFILFNHVRFYWSFLGLNPSHLSRVLMLLRPRGGWWERFLLFFIDMSNVPFLLLESFISWALTSAILLE